MQYIKNFTSIILKSPIIISPPSATIEHPG